MLNSFRKSRLAIDFGTANCLIIKDNQGVVLNEPTVLALSTKERKVLAIGLNAKKMLGKVPKGIEAKRPLKNGGISNIKLAEMLMSKFLSKILGNVRIISPEVIVSVPAGLSSVEERAMSIVLSRLGIRKSYLLPEPVAAAIGAEMPIHTSSGNLIVNLGAGTAEIAVISLNGIVSFKSHIGAGDAINESIIRLLKRDFALIIGEVTAEEIKLKIGTLKRLREPNILVVEGKDLVSGLPKKVKVTSNDLIPAIKEVTNDIIISLKEVLSNTPPELVPDIIERGAVMSGGTAMLDGLSEEISNSLNIPAYVVEDPLTCVVRGLSKSIDKIEELKLNLKI